MRKRYYSINFPVLILCINYTTSEIPDKNFNDIYKLCEKHFKKS